MFFFYEFDCKIFGIKIIVFIFIKFLHIPHAMLFHVFMEQIVSWEMAIKYWKIAASVLYLESA